MPDPTPNIGLARPDFNVVTWHDEVNGNFTILDAIIAATGLNVVGAWENSFAYSVGQAAVDTVSGTLWQCAVAHTSAATGVFSADRAANPTYWVQITALSAESIRTVTAAGVVTQLSTDDIILINKTVGAPTTVNLLTAAGRTRPLMIVDLKGDAGTNAITVTPTGVETIVGLATWVINNNQGSIRLRPRPDGLGWYI
ncbi:MAG: hypothetical protein MN733_03500 [Nitrososphaera sp.]|nr:hypothetical protein [Nitrososphaera sp.]